MKKYVFLALIMTLLGCKKNTLLINTSNRIDREDVKIEMEVLPSIKKIIIFENNKENDIPNGYGENEWRLIYKDSLKGYFRHFKTNRNDKYKYLFDISESDKNEIVVDVTIEGDNPLQKQIILK